MRFGYKEYNWEEFRQLHPDKAEEMLRKNSVPPKVVRIPVFLCTNCKHCLTMDGYCFSCTDEECLFEPRE
jgi:hypothetical protein